MVSLDEYRYTFGVLRALEQSPQALFDGSATFSLQAAINVLKYKREGKELLLQWVKQPEMKETLKSLVKADQDIAHVRYQDAATAIDSAVPPCKDAMQSGLDSWKYVEGQKLIGDTAKGEDKLGLEIMANIFAEYLASMNLDPPFVLAIIGKWGSGKSFFFNLVVKYLIELQKNKVSENSNSYVGHMYVIRFDAWTYGKKCLWASLMYRIFKDLSHQLDLEASLAENHNLRDGGVSIIELCQNLSDAEQEYIKDLKGKNIDFFDLLKRSRRNGDRVSESFSKVFASQMDEDADELHQAEENLKRNTNTTIWKSLRENNNCRSKTMARNVLQEAVLSKITKAGEGKKGKEMMAKSLDENFDDQFNYLEKVWLRFISGASLINIFLSITFVLIGISGIILLEAYGSHLNKWIKGLTNSISGVLGIGTPLIIWSKKAYAEAAKYSEEFSDKVKIAQGMTSDIEAAFTNESTKAIRQEQNKINEIKKRLTVLEGESMQNVVRNRVKSDAYLSQLGIVHRAKEDLDRLSESMNQRYSMEKVDFRVEKKNKIKALSIVEEVESLKEYEIITGEDQQTVPVLVWNDTTFLLLVRNNSKNGWWIKGKEEATHVLVGVNCNKQCKMVKEWTLEQSYKDCYLNIAMDEGSEQCEFSFCKHVSESTPLVPLPPLEIPFDDIRKVGSFRRGMQKNAKLFPRGKPRIILFVDDLDRCNPDKVVDVLEAMQLLVKTNLFVIVAAIDTRYVCLSLENREKYDKILKGDISPTGLDFLEKIIQIPYCLPQASAVQMNAFVDSQIEVEDEPFVDSQIEVEDEPRQELESPSTSLSGNESAESAELSQPSAPSVKRSSNPDPTEQDIIAQKFHPEEAELLKKACNSFKLAPRSVTRIVNVFKIMKVFWHRHNAQTGQTTTREMKINSLLLLVMASSEKTKKGMQTVFNMMEDQEVPLVENPELREENEGAPNCDTEKAQNELLDENNNSHQIYEKSKSLFEIIREKSDDKIPLETWESDLFDSLKSITIDSEKKWKTVSEDFTLARSFSFFHNIDDEKQFI